MVDQEFVSEMAASPEALWNFHAAKGAFGRLSPPWKDVVLRSDPGRIADGLEPLLELRLGPLKKRWRARYESVIPGKQFTDVQVSGPFAAWSHRHEVRPVAGNSEGSVLSDQVRYELPLWALGRVFAGGLIARDLERLFAWRHAVTREDLQDAKTLPAERGRVLVTGAGGMVGTALVAALSVLGFEVIRAVRRPAARPDEVTWNPEQGLENPAALEGMTGLIHLAGENIAGGRWTRERRAAIAQSRIAPTRRLADQLANLKAPPKAAIMASAIGFYGSEDRGPLTEDDGPGEGWLAKLALDWEAAAAPLLTRSRVVHARLGIVLSPKGGALAKMLPPFRFGLGGRLGSGLQPMSWISIEDLVRILRRALVDSQIEGPINCVAPEPATNAAFTKALGQVLGRPTVLPAPSFALRAVFGRDFADQMLLGGVAVKPGRLLSLGFDYAARDLKTALQRLLGKKF